jgi:carboxyl-terminal processing protease
MHLSRSLFSIAICAGLLLAGPAHAEDPAKLAEQALAAYTAKDFARSADLFLAAAKSDAENPALFYNGACSAALAGRADDAFSRLQRAVDLGWGTAEQLSKDSDLASLHADPRWQQLIGSLERAAVQRDKLWNNPALATPWNVPLTEDQRVAGLSRLWSEAKYNFVNFDLVPALDWDAAYLQALPRVRAAASNQAYYRELQAFAALLRDGHTGVYAEKDATDAWDARPGVDTLLLEGRVIVRDVFDPALKDTGLQAGWEIVAVEGQPVRAYAAAAVEPYMSGLTPQDRAMRTFEYYLLSGRGDTPVRVTVRDLLGTEHKLALPRMPAEARYAAQPRKASFEWKLLPGKVALVTLRSFGNDSAADEYLKHFEEIAKADAIVFDLRDNSGGNSGVGYRILATLTDKPFLTSAWRTRDYRPTYRAWKRGEMSYRGEPGEIAPDAAHRYDRPVVVLTSARTYSAAEDFVVAFDAMKRGRLVGETTGGSTGQPLAVALPGGAFVRICTKRDTYPDGREFVGVGIKPQLPAQPTVAAFRAGRDTVLDAATRLLHDGGAAGGSSGGR